MAWLREQFITVLGHDLRNPLASISSGVRLLTEWETASPRGGRILSLTLGSVMRASELVDNVMDFARGRLGGGITLSSDALAPLAPVLEQVVAEIVSVAEIVNSEPSTATACEWGKCSLTCSATRSPMGPRRC